MSPSSRKTEQVQYTIRPPTRSKGHKARSRVDCCCASAAISVSRRNQGTSGWRRTMPDAVHGASSKMASNELPVPPVARPGSIGGQHMCLQAQPIEGLADPGATLRVDVERGQRTFGQFEQMRGLATGRGTGIEHAQRRAGPTALQ